MKKLESTFFRFVRLALIGMLVIFFLWALPPPGSGAPATFYKGKVLTFVVPFNPGGGYDTYARLIASYLKKEIGAKVIVRNMPGGQTYVAAKYVYHRKPDGLTIFIADAQALMMNQLAREPRAKGIDARKFNWLCGVTYDPTVLCLGTKSPYRSLEDLKSAKETVKFGAMSKGDRMFMSVSVLAEVLGLDAQIIIGFPGVPALTLAIMKGELDGYAGGGSTAAQVVKQPELFPVCAISPVRNPVLPEVPALGELVSLTPEQQKWIDFLDKIAARGRPIVTTPGVPQERVQSLRMALHKCLNDEQLLAEAEKIKRPIGYWSGEEFTAHVNETLNMPEERAKEIIHLLMEKYVKRLMK